MVGAASEVAVKASHKANAQLEGKSKTLPVPKAPCAAPRANKARRLPKRL
jgi:hypothetical protein